MLNSDINFTSRIQITDLNGLKKEVCSFPSKISVKHPWTYEQTTERVQQAYTTRIRDCIAGGIVAQDKEGAKQVVMFHISPRDEKNFDFDKIKETIINKLSPNSSCRAFLVGGKNKLISSNSLKIFDKFEEFIQSMKIPCSKIKGLGIWDEAHIAYNGLKDMWNVCVVDIRSCYTDVPEYSSSLAKEVYIDAGDELISMTTKTYPPKIDQLDMKKV